MRDGARLPDGVSLIHDVGCAAWLVSRLNEASSEQRPSGSGAPSVSTVVPSGYAAYVEVSLRNGRGGQRRIQQVLASHTAPNEPCYSAIWDGWPCAARWEGTPGLVIPFDFALVLFTHICDDTAALWSLTGGDETLRWPANREWVIARPVDSDALYLACDEQLAEAVMRHGDRDVRLVKPSDPHMDDEPGDDLV